MSNDRRKDSAICEEYGFSYYAATELPEQPAPESDEWCIRHVAEKSSDWMVIAGDTFIARTCGEQMAQQLVTDHARAALVPGLVQAIEAEATRHAYATGLGASEWEAFLWLEARAALAAAAKERT